MNCGRAMADWILQAREALQQGPAALVTILATEGSAPRGPGARMIVTETKLAGSIGGGALERQATQQARAILAHPPGTWRVQDYPLGPFLGQCCGGRVRLLVERLERAPAGEGPFEVTLSEHVDRRLPNGQRPATLEARGPLPTAGTRFLEPVETDCLISRDRRIVGMAWYDSRPEMAETPGVVLATESEMVAEAAAAPEGAAILILTHDHALDYRITAAALGGRARFVGLIGSKTKRARFVSRLTKDGVDAARLICPIGVPGIGGREPEVIAIAALAQLLMVKDAR
jgi:xanthine dehydrogenase accessory factor